MVLQEQSQPELIELDLTEASDEPRCCHHWVIQPANGPVSRGECQNCGEEREFRNSVEEYQEDWHNI